MNGSLRSDASLTPLGRPFWLFLLVCLLFDVGFGLYFFLINLYLAQIHLDTKVIGLIAGAVTVGNVLATLPVGLLARRFGLRPILLFGFMAAPLFAAARAFVGLWSVQVSLAVLQGAAMCCYTVCFPPALARVTAEDRRTTAFSITFAVGIGSGALAGLAGGWIPGWLQQAGRAHDISIGMRIVLLSACTIALFGVIPLLKLWIPECGDDFAPRSSVSSIKHFLVPFLTAVAIWNAAIGAFAPFANLYLSGVLRIRLTHIGLIFSASQLLQVVGVSTAPLLYRVFGKMRGIGYLQLAAAAALLALGHVPYTAPAIGLYLLLMCFQYTCSPGIYTVAMDRAEPHLQSSVSACQNMVTCVSLATAAALAGVVIARYGYSALLTSAAVCAGGAAVLFIAMDPTQLRRVAPQSLETDLSVSASIHQ